MLKIERIDINGFQAAIRGMRNPMNSWDKSDSGSMAYPECFYVGNNDIKLMKQLTSAGDDHSKFLRMITVTCDITAPLYWWKEFDTYKVGTVANSCSTMHKIHTKEFTDDDFSMEHLIEDDDNHASFVSSMHRTIADLNTARELYLKTNDKKYWWQMIQLLPSSYNQKRTVQLNYQVLKNMYHARRNHKLDEWHTFCDRCEELPYFKKICIGGE